LNEDAAKKISEEFGEDRVFTPGKVDVTDEVRVKLANKGKKFEFKVLNNIYYRIKLIELWH
jgi:hypothetical protein